MIRLVGTSNKYETTINHTGTDTGVNHNITHNLGTKDIEVAIYHPEGADSIITTPYFYAPPSASWGYLAQYLTLNTVQLRLYRWYPGSNEFANYTAKVIITTK
jgi:hypothetical protein